VLYPEQVLMRLFSPDSWGMSEADTGMPLSSREMFSRDLTHKEILVVPLIFFFRVKNLLRL
jgi:hypothetical protein